MGAAESSGSFNGGNRFGMPWELSVRSLWDPLVSWELDGSFGDRKPNCLGRGVSSEVTGWLMGGSWETTASYDGSHRPFGRSSGAWEVAGSRLAVDGSHFPILTSCHRRCPLLPLVADAAAPMSDPGRPGNPRRRPRRLRPRCPKLPS